MKLFVGLSLAALGLFSISAALNRDERRPLTFATPQIESRSAILSTSMPVVVELFTSEGCSSCPPADQLLSRLDKEQSTPGANIIATLIHRRSSAPDRAATQKRSGATACTPPQMVVDGRLEFVGNNATKAQEAITEAANSPKAKVQIELAANTETRVFKTPME